MPASSERRSTPMLFRSGASGSSLGDRSAPEQMGAEDEPHSGRHRQHLVKKAAGPYDGGTRGHQVAAPAVLGKAEGAALEGAAVQADRHGEAPVARLRR